MRRCVIPFALACWVADAAAQPEAPGPPLRGAGAPSHVVDAGAPGSLDAPAPAADADAAPPALKPPADAAPPALKPPADAAPPALKAPADAAPPVVKAPADAAAGQAAVDASASEAPADGGGGGGEGAAAADASASEAPADGGGGEGEAAAAADAGVGEDAADAGVGGVAAAPPAPGAAAPTRTPAPEEVEAAEEERAVDAPVVETPPEAPPGSAEGTLFALKLIFGLAVLLAIAYVGGHPRVLRLQERVGVRGVVLAGFPFVALGLIASLPSVGILTDEVIPKLRPVLQLGLGWIGFLVGAQLDIRVLDRVPRGSAYLLLVEALAPFCVTALACGAVMIGVFGLSLRDPAAWRDIVLLGAAAAMTAPRRFRGFSSRPWSEGRGADVLLGQLDEIVGVIGLLFIMAYFRSDATSAWQLPGTAWLFVAVGLGVVIGVLIFATIRVPRSNAEFLAIVLGAIAFASGLAGVLRLSPLVTCFIAGVLVTNFPNEQRESVFRILDHLERPLHLLFLIIAGALWNVTDERGWALVPLFVACRVLGKWLGVAMTRTTMGARPPAELTGGRKLVLPMSTMAIALVVSIERFRDVGLSWVVTAVIGGSIVTELLVAAIDDDDDDDDPSGTYSGRATPIDELDEREAPRAGGPP